MMPLTESMLAGVRAKIKRAKYHICDLESQIQRFLDNEPYGTSVDNDPQTGENVHRVKLSAEIPDDFPLIIGDAVHSLRSSLDHLACQLAVANGGTIGRQSFPIFETAAKYKGMKPTQVEGISPAAISLFETVQPYQSGYEAIWKLHDLDNTDKHRLLVVAAFDVVGILWSLGKRWPYDAIRPEDVLGVNIRGPGLLQDGTEIGRVPPDYASDMDVYSGLTALIAFREPKIVEREPVLPLLTQLTCLVEQIIDLFHALP
jgi:hypothetical protein